MSIRVNYTDDTADEVVFETYPDGTFYTKFRPPVDSRVESVYFQGTTLNELLQALFLVDALEGRGKMVNEFQIPFIPGGRQDRKNSEGDFLVTLLSVADLINSYGFDRVVTSDPHSEATLEMIDNIWVNNEVDFFGLFRGDYAGVIAPDKGAASRANSVGRALGLPTFYAGKTRDVETGRLTGFTFPEELTFGNYLVVDDICDGGGTFIGLSDAAPERVSLDLYVTHGLFTKGVADLTEAYKNIYTRFLYGAWENIVPQGVRLVGENY